MLWWDKKRIFKALNQIKSYYLGEVVALGVGVAVTLGVGEAIGEAIGEPEGEGLGEGLAKAAMLTSKVEVTEKAAAAANERLVFFIWAIRIIELNRGLKIDNFSEEIPAEIEATPNPTSVLFYLCLREFVSL